mmetsp:Transcript_9580/g.35872  ORF Transcript_9580/g.35872 Transcript_9580/m.35872 type:complete len:733 (+) Transcript_9580:406-2604(+)
MAWLDHTSALVLECVLMLPFWFDWFLTLWPCFRNVAKRGCRSMKISWKATFLSLVLLASLVDLLVASNMPPGAVRMSPYIRILMVFVYVGGVREELAGILGHVDKFVVLALLAMLFIVAFGFFGTVIFENSHPSGRRYFPDLGESLWQLQILLTTNNWPDLSMAAYNDNRWYFIYFFLYLVVGLFILLNVLTALVFNVYIDDNSSRKSERRQHKLQSMERAFETLAAQNESLPPNHVVDSPIKDGSQGEKHDAEEALEDATKRRRGEAYVSKDQFFTLMRNLNRFLVIPYVPPPIHGIVFAILDDNGSNVLERGEFYMIMPIMKVRISKEAESAFEYWTPGLWRRTELLRRVVLDPNFENVVDLILAVNAIVVVVELWPYLEGDTDETANTSKTWEIVVDIFFSIVFTCETTLKIFAMGLRRYWRDFWNKFDLLITCLCVTSIAIIFDPNDFNDPRLLRYIVLVRPLRLLRFLSRFKSVRQLSEILVAVFGYTRGPFLLLSIVTLAFVAFGVDIYGGLINLDPARDEYAALLDTAYGTATYGPDKEYDREHFGYYTINLNDYAGGVVLLFSCLVGNNWDTFVDAFVAVTSKNARLFFIVYWIIGTLLVFNVVISSVVDRFTTEFSRVKTVDESPAGGGSLEARGGSVRGIEIRLDNAATVTGTSTGVQGSYVISFDDLDDDDDAVLWGADGVPMYNARTVYGSLVQASSYPPGNYGATAEERFHVQKGGSTL